MSASTDSVAGFYGRYADLYDAIATLPGVDRWRAAAADALDLRSGETVIEMGCGTGANLPHLARCVGPDGGVLGVDLTPELLSVARGRTESLPQASVVRGDATRPPVDDADAVLGTFVTGMFADPARVVDDWCDLVGPGGRVAVMDLSASSSLPGSALNPLFRVFTATSAPSSTPADIARSVFPGAAADATLTRRVDAARETLVARTAERRYRTFGLGFCGLFSGTVE
jgi:ubiquinone/menaquinone biosynthesis C-methylase UbiE